MDNKIDWLATQSTLTVKILDQRYQPKWSWTLNQLLDG
jgi:hypothetical protein